MSEATDTSPMISVIIPTRDRAEDLAQSLPSVLAIDYPDFEVIVVDQSTTDDTQHVVVNGVSAARDHGHQWELVVAEGASKVTHHLPQKSESPEKHRLIYRRTPTVGVSLSLNEGIRNAQGDIMAFTPDDSRVPQDWLRRAAAVLADEPQAGMVFGAVAAEEHDWRHTFVPWFVPQGYRRLQGRLAYLQFRGVMGANMFVRRAVFHRLGGFDECLGTGCRFHSHEDADLAYRALRAGFAVVLDPENAVVHWGGRDFSDGSAQRLIRNTRYGKGAFLVKHIRCGDPVAALALLQGASGEFKYLITNLIMHRTFRGGGRLLYLLGGVFAGFRQRVDRQRWVYLPVRGNRE